MMPRAQDAERRVRAFPAPPEPGSLERVLVRAPNWIGDVVAATPVLEACREAFGTRSLRIAVRGAAADVLRGGSLEPCLVRLADSESLDTAFDGAAPDVGILLTHSFSSARAMRRAGARRVFGYATGWRRFLLTDPVLPLREGLRRVPVPMVRHYADLVSVLGVLVRDLRPRLHYEPEVGERAAQILERQGIPRDAELVVLHPGAAFGPSKRWPPADWAAVVDELSERGYALYLHAGPGERDVLTAIRAHARSDPAGADREALDLHLLKPVVERARAMITTDSAPRHYANAFEVPVVVLMGPTDPRYTSANLESTALLRAAVDCGPCQRPRCVLDHACMRGIRPGDVLTALDDLLDPV